MASQPLSCAGCGSQVSRSCQSGYCRSCAARRSYQVDPVRKAEALARLALAARDPQVKEQRRKRWVEGRFWEKGQSAQPKGSSSRQRMAKSLSATHLAWCPPHLRERYRMLVRSKKLKAADARRIILEENEIEMRRWRRSVGAEPRPPAILGTGVSFIDRASAVAARHADVALIWTASQNKEAVRARQAVFLALRRGGWAWTRIASETGMGRKTIKWGVQRAEMLVSCDPDFAALYAKIVAA